MAKQKVQRGKVATVDSVRLHIAETLKAAFTSLGLSPVTPARGETIFVAALNGNRHDIIQMARIAFLERQQARYFGCSTASFVLEVGVYYAFVPGATLGKLGWPAPEACHIRAVLPRPFRQRPPNRELGRADRLRRDIWWVDETPEALERILKLASRTLLRKAKPWLARYSDLDFACWYLQRWPGKAHVVGAPLNLGTRDSPYRQELIRALQARIAVPSPDEPAQSTPSEGA